MVIASLAIMPYVLADPRSTAGPAGPGVGAVKVADAGENGLAAYVAVMCDVPTALPVAMPVFNPTVATTRLSELQVEVSVLSAVVPSLNVSIAVYVWVPLTGIEAVAGITSNFLDVAAVTVK